MGRHGGNWTWYEYRAIQTMDHLFNEIRALEGMFSLPLPRGVHSWCCVTSSLSICTAPPTIGAGTVPAPTAETKFLTEAPHQQSGSFQWDQWWKLDVNWQKHAGWKMVRLSLMHSWSPHVILSKELWHYYIIMELIFTNGPYISVSYLYMWCTNWYQLHTFLIYIYIYTYQHQSFEYTVCKVILPLAHGHPQCILRATSLNDPRSTEQAYRQKECGQGAFPKRDAKKPCQDWPKRVNTKSGKTMQWYWHVGDSVWLHHPKVAFPAHTHTFQAASWKNPTTCKVHEQLARTCGTFPQLQLAVVPFLLMIMIFLIGVVACCGNLLIHTGSNYPCKIKCMDLKNESTKIRCGKRQHIVSDIKYKLVPLISSVHPSFTSATSITLSSSCMNFMGFAKFGQIENISDFALLFCHL